VCCLLFVEPPPRVDEVPAAEAYDNTFETVHAALVGESDTILTQFALTMTPLTDAIEHRDAELNALRAEKRDFLKILAVVDVLQAANAQVERLQLSENDYATLTDRRAELVQKLTEKCCEFTDAEDYDNLRTLAPKLAQLMIAAPSDKAAVVKSPAKQRKVLDPSAPSLAAARGRPPPVAEIHDWDYDPQLYREIL
jgi:predicted house-cleaning noncanonical NTP pyrophosphatase (MazG superfamily)